MNNKPLTYSYREGVASKTIWLPLEIISFALCITTFAMFYILKTGQYIPLWMFCIVLGLILLLNLGRTITAFKLGNRQLVFKKDTVRYQITKKSSKTCYIIRNIGNTKQSLFFYKIEGNIEKRIVQGSEILYKEKLENVKIPRIFKVGLREIEDKFDYYN